MSHNWSNMPAYLRSVEKTQQEQEIQMQIQYIAMTALILARALCGLEVEKRYLQRKAKLLAAFLVLQLVLGVLLLLKWAV